MAIKQSINEFLVKFGLDEENGRVKLNSHLLAELKCNICSCTAAGASSTCLLHAVDANMLDLVYETSRVIFHNLPAQVSALGAECMKELGNTGKIPDWLQLTSQDSVVYLPSLRTEAMIALLLAGKI